jgi:hypothetical protein
LDFYTKSPKTNPTINDLNINKLRVIRSANSRRSSSAIISDIKALFMSRFNHKTTMLGQTVDIYQLTSDILSIDGIEAIKTYRSDTNTTTNGLSLLFWNNIYPTQDVSVYSQNVFLDYFKYPVFNNLDMIEKRIEVFDQNGTLKPTEF